MNADGIVKTLIYAYENCNILKPQHIRNPIDDAIKLIESLQAELAEREKGCEYCDDNFKFWQMQISGELPNVRYCPMCGKRLEVEP